MVINLKYYFDVTLAINTLIISKEGNDYDAVPSQLWGLTMVQYVPLLYTSKRNVILMF
jgi:hypothetical protein